MSVHIAEQERAIEVIDRQEFFAMMCPPGYKMEASEDREGQVHLGAISWMKTQIDSQWWLNWRWSDRGSWTRDDGQIAQVVPVAPSLHGRGAEVNPLNPSHRPWMHRLMCWTCVGVFPVRSQLLKFLRSSRRFAWRKIALHLLGGSGSSETSWHGTNMEQASYWEYLRIIITLHSRYFQQVLLHSLLYNLSCP